MAIIYNEKIQTLNDLLKNYGLTVELTHLYNIRFKSNQSNKMNYVLNSFNELNIDKGLDCLIDEIDFIGTILKQNYESSKIKIDKKRTKNILVEINKDDTTTKIKYDRKLKVANIKTSASINLNQFFISLDYSFLKIHSPKSETYFDLETETITVKLDEIEPAMNEMISKLDKDRKSIGL